MGITNLRIRGMWTIKNPLTVFDYIYEPNDDCEFNFMCFMSNEKYNSFSNKDGLDSLITINPSFLVQDVEVKNPNNPAQLISAKLISFWI